MYRKYLKRPLEWHQHQFELTQNGEVRADWAGSIETNPFSCRPSEPCTAPAKSAVVPALSPQICASVNGFCVAAGAEQSEFRLLHSSRYWPTLSLIILANIDTACVVSHLYPFPLPLPCLTESERTEREREQKTEKELLKGREGMMRQRNVLAFTGLCFIMM